MIPYASKYGAGLNIPEKHDNLGAEHSESHQIHETSQSTLISPTDPTVVALAALFDTLSAEQRASLSVLLISSISATARAGHNHRYLRCGPTAGLQPREPESRI
jgi:hypothetical protein